MWSFLNQSVPVFAIAIITAVLAQALFRGQDEARIRRFKQLNYYVIGFFGIGSIAVLLLLSGFLRLVFTGLRYDGADLFTIVSLVTFGGYVLAMLVLLYRLTSAAFRGDPGTGWSKTIKLRVLLCNLVVIALCVFNFVSPLYQRDEGAPPLQGRLVDIHESPDEGLRITFLIKNVSTTDVVLNLLDDVTVAAENTEGSRQEETDRICSSRKPGASLPGFTLLAAQKSTLLEFCTGNQRLLGLIKEAGYVEIARSQGGMRLKNTSKQKLQFSARLRVVIGNRRGGDLEVPLT